MKNITRVRVVARPSNNKSQYEQFKELLHVFKRRCNEAGILSKFKEHEFFESESQKARKKQREAELRRKKEKEEEQMLKRHGAGVFKKNKRNQDIDETEI